MASTSTPPPVAARSASTLYECPCSGSEIPRYSRKKCAASKRASTRTLNVPWPKTRSIIASLMPSSRASAADDCERSSDSARLSSQQSLALLPSASAINDCNVLRRSSTASKCTMRRDSRDATPEKRPLPRLQEDVSRRLEALSLLRIRRAARPPGRAGAAFHESQSAGVRAEDGDGT